MLKIHDDLMDRKFVDLCDQLTMVICLQKSALDQPESHSAAARPPNTSFSPMLTLVYQQGPQFRDTTTFRLQTSALGSYEDVPEVRLA